MINVELYTFIPISVTLIVFQGHSSVKQFQLIILCSYPIKLKLCGIVKYIRQAMNLPVFDFHTYSRGMIGIFCDLFFSQTLFKQGFSNFCFIITLCVVYLFISGLMA